MGTPEVNKEIVSHYFAAVNRGDLGAIVGMLDDHVTFWVPPSLPDGVEYRGKETVLRLFAESVGLYDPEAGLNVEIKCLTAEEDRVAAELVIRGRSSADGGAYENWYHFLFHIHAGLIIEIREHLDSLYAYRKLFEPAGITERSHCKWLP